MKQYYIIILTLFISGISAIGGEKGKHLFILSGQSNMVGLRPAESFTPAVVNELGEGNVIFVKHSQGGQPISRWYKKWEPAKGNEPEAKGDLYDSLMNRVNAAVQGKKILTVTFIWMQGERDAREKHGAVYKESLKGLIHQLSEDFNREDIYFVIGRLSDFDMNNEKYPHWTMVRGAQVEVTEGCPRGAWVNTDDLNDGLNRRGKKISNGLHYTKEGYKILGQRFAEKAISLIRQSGN